MNPNNLAYFDSFVVEHIPREIKKFMGGGQMFIEYKHTIR